MTDRQREAMNFMKRYPTAPKERVAEVFGVPLNKVHDLRLDIQREKEKNSLLVSLLAKRTESGISNFLIQGATLIKTEVALLSLEEEGHVNIKYFRGSEGRYVHVKML